MGRLLCSICLYVPPLPDEGDGTADTVINGEAVCVDHAGLVAGGPGHARAIAIAVREAGFESLSALQQSRRSG